MSPDLFTCFVWFSAGVAFAMFVVNVCKIAAILHGKESE